MIAKLIGREFSFPPKLVRVLSDGSIDPDIHPDYTYRVYGYRHVKVRRTAESHHNASTSLIMKYVWKSRDAWLKGNVDGALFNLGRALHYVQDKCVSKGFLGLFHDRIERNLSEANLPEYPFNKVKRKAKASPHFVKNVLNSLRPEKDADKILEKAITTSILITAATLGSKEIPKELLEAYENAKQKFTKRTKPAAIGIGLISTILLLMFDPLFFPIGLILGYIIYWSDRNYHNLKEEAKWYGIQ